MSNHRNHPQPKCQSFQKQECMVVPRLADDGRDKIAELPIFGLRVMPGGNLDVVPLATRRLPRPEGFLGAVLREISQIHRG